MLCPFKNEEGRCFFCKQKCFKGNSAVKNCKYYKRQFPETKELLVDKVQKALELVMKKRDLFNNSIKIDVEKLINPNKSVYENVKFIVEELPTIDISYKVKKKIDTQTLIEDKDTPVNSIYKNLYDIKTLKICEKYEDSNEVLIKEDDIKLICKLKKPVNEFLVEIQKKRKQGEYLQQNIIEVRQI